MASKLDVSPAQPANIFTIPRTGYADTTKDYINHPWYKSQNGVKRKHGADDLDASSAEESSEDDAYTSDGRAGVMYLTPQSSHAQTRRISSLPASHMDGHHSAKRRCVALEKNFAGMKIDPTLSSSSGSYVLQQPQLQWANATYAISPDSDPGAPILDVQYADSPLSQMSSISANSTRNNSPNVSISYLSPQMEMNYAQVHPGAGFVVPSNVEEPCSSPEIEKDGGLLPSLDINESGFDKKRDREAQAWFEPVKDRIVITDLDALASTDNEDNDVDNDTTPKARSKIKNNLSSSGVSSRRLRFNIDSDADQDEDDSYTMNALMLKYIKKHTLTSFVNNFPDSSDSNDDKKSDAMALVPFRPVAPFAPQAFGTVPLPPVNDMPLMEQGQGQVGGFGMNIQVDSDFDMSTNMNGERMGSILNGNSMQTSSMNYATGMEDIGMDVDDPMDVEY